MSLSGELRWKSCSREGVKDAMQLLPATLVGQGNAISRLQANGFVSAVISACVQQKVLTLELSYHAVLTRVNVVFGKESESLK